MKSFSGNVKSELASDTLKSKVKTCCAFSLIYGIMSFSRLKDGRLFLKTTNAEIKKLFSDICTFLNSRIKFFHESKNGEISLEAGFIKYSTFAEYNKFLFKCPHCAEYYMKGMFLSHATLNNPKNSYRLEFVFDTNEGASTVSSVLSSIGTEAKYGFRNSKHVLYIKESTKIEDFLASIGANNAAFTLINEQILKELRNNANRATNCDAANISKSVNASKKYISVINELQKSGDFELLTDQLKEAAFKRIEFEELNFSDLGKKFDPPISKSGIYHRLERIVEFYDKIKKDRQ